MKTQKTDRRSERTRRLLGEALVALLLEKRYDEITVQDILDRADVGRSTFYAHYYDKEDLLTSEIERVVDVLSRHLGAAPDGPIAGIPSLGLFRHLQELPPRFYQAVMQGFAAETVLRALQTILSQRVEQQVRTQLPRPVPDLTAALIAQAAVGSFLALLRWWVDTGMRIPPEQMDSYFQRLVLPGIRQVLANET